jgi:hypothetical protein
MQYLIVKSSGKHEYSVAIYRITFVFLDERCYSSKCSSSKNVSHENSLCFLFPPSEPSDEVTHSSMFKMSITKSLLWFGSHIKVNFLFASLCPNLRHHSLIVSKVKSSSCLCSHKKCGLHIHLFPE